MGPCRQIDDHCGIYVHNDDTTYSALQPKYVQFRIPLDQLSTKDKLK